MQSQRRESMSQQDRDDLSLSHAFVNAVTASYRGLYAYENVHGSLDDAPDRLGRVREAGWVLEQTDDWWRQLRDGRPLFRRARRPVLDREAAKVWRLLEGVEGRLRSLVGELSEYSSLEALLEDRTARHIRIAALCESSHERDHLVRGLIAFGELVGAWRDVDTWRQHTLTCRQRVERAEALYRRFGEAEGGDVERDLVAELFDVSLLLPYRFGIRVVEINQVFGMYTGIFDYPDAGVPAAQAEDWKRHGFAPMSAGRWFLAGLTPRRALEWMRAGADDALTAAGYLWRDFEPGSAEPWIRHRIGARQAAAWRDADCTVEEARHWMRHGMRRPDDRPEAIQEPSRLM